MPKGVCGILGRYANPKKPVLFSFTSQNWPSGDEDSDDRDYDPAQEIDNMELNANSLETLAGGLKKDRNLQKNGKKKHHASAKKGSQKQNWVVSNGTNEGGGMKLKIRRDENSMKERKRKKDKPLKDPDKKVKRKKSDSTSEPTVTEDFVEGPWGKFLPLELLVRIFREGFNLEGVFPFLHRVQQVCMLWREASMHRMMWEHVDLSSDMIRKSDFFLKELFEERDFSLTKRINLSGWGDKLTFEGLKRIASTCPLLTSINLMGCIGLKVNGIKLLVDSCPNLSHIDISRINSKASYSNTSYPSNCLKYIAEKCGAHLTYLNISENTVGNLAPIIKSLAEHCPNLEVLDACNLNSSSNIILPVEEFQVGCPRLRVLRLANSHTTLQATPLSAQVKAPGFPDLEELSIAEVENKIVPCQLGDNDLDRLLKSSHKLRLLDVRGCHHISVSGLVRLPAWDIQQLYLTRCAASRSPDLELILKKWSHSLKNVDLSWANDANAIDQGIIALASVEGQSPLEVVDLCGSAVSYSSIQKLFEKCSRLQSLNLQSCRGLPRGIKRFLTGQELAKLKETI